MIGGAGFVLAAVQTGVARRRLLRRAVRVTGRVVRVRPEYDVDSDAARETPVVRYHGPDGEAREYQLPHPFPVSRWRVGDRVPMLIDPAAPAAAVWANRPWSEVVLTASMGLLAVAVGAACYWLMVDPARR